MLRVNALLLLLIASMPAFGQAQPRYVASRDVLLAFGGGENVDRVEGWVTEDDGKAWAPAEVERVGDGQVRYSALRDGRYGFYLLLENEAGRSAEPPLPGDKPHISVIVDTAPPTLQIRRAKAKSGAAPPAVELRLTLLEENLGPGGLRLFYRAGRSQGWTDGGALHVPARTADAAEAVVSWPTTAGIAERLDLMLTCTDRAGNAARDEILAVRTVAADHRDSDDAPRSSASRPGRGEIATSAPSPLQETRSPATGDLARAEQMRALAARFLAEGRTDLASARFSDALAESPNDPQLLTEYGTALVRSNRLDDARQRFEAALSAAPKNTAALEGLALVAMGQQRLTDARENLKRLLEIDSGAGRVWLRYGDVEYRMGNRTAAIEAWTKAGGTTDAQLQATARDRLKTLQH
jgi:hypothetical protein